jgi:hypothetical protein
MHHISYTWNVRHGEGCGWGGFPAEGRTSCLTSIEGAAWKKLVRIALRVPNIFGWIPEHGLRRRSILTGFPKPKV